MSGLRRKLKDSGIKLDCSGIMYGFRHSYATEMLKRGVPEAHVAQMLGHKSTAMLSKHYSHLSSEIGTLVGHLCHIGVAAGEVRTASGGNPPGNGQVAPAVDETTGRPLEGGAA